MGVIRSNAETYIKGLARKALRPDIHFILPEINSGQGYGPEVALMIRDLHTSINGISNKQIADLTGVSPKTVRIALAGQSLKNPLSPIIGSENDDNNDWFPERNEAACRAELVALCAAHPGRMYEEDPAGLVEENGELFSDFARSPHAPAYRKADQSHTVPRPITLPSVPFDHREFA